MSNIKSARLALNSFITNGNDIYGSTNANKTKYTFNNINLRTLLGDLWDKYDTFNLCLKSMISGVQPEITFGTTLNDLAVFIMIDGLPFINCTYDLYSGFTGTFAILTTFNFKRNEAVQVNYNDNNLTFSKNQEIVNLTFTYESVEDGQLPNTPTGINFPEITYIFDIVGVGEAKNVNQIMNQRII